MMMMMTMIMVMMLKPAAALTWQIFVHPKWRLEEEKIPIMWLPLSIIFVPLFHLNTFDKKRNETLIEFLFFYFTSAQFVVV